MCILMTQGEETIFRQNKISCTLFYSNINVPSRHTETLRDNNSSNKRREQYVNTIGWGGKEKNSWAYSRKIILKPEALFNQLNGN